MIVTPSSDTAAVILAAGKGTRMKSTQAKALFPLCGRPLIHYPIATMRAAGIEHVVIVVGHQADAVRLAAGDGIQSALQEPQKGTGHALMSAEDALRDFTGTIVVHCVDAPLLPAEVVTDMLTAHRVGGNAATLLTARMADPGGYGRILRANDGTVCRIVEARDATPEELAVREVNAGSYCFEAPLIFSVLRELTPDNDQGEYYLTDVVERLLAHGQRVGAVTAPNEAVVAGINDRVQLAEAERMMRGEICRRHMRNGVTIIDPTSTFIDADVEIGQDTIIYPFTLVYAGTRIGAHCEIGPFTQLYGATIEDDVQVDSSRVESSLLRAGAKVGPFSRLRANCELLYGAEVGNFSELKNTRIGEGSVVHHLGYLGDTTLGAGVNIGAGTITCNYDGQHKHPTRIGDRAFIGSGNLLVAPITVGEHALTGAGSVVTRDVPPNKVAYGVPARVMRDRERG